MTAVQVSTGGIDLRPFVGRHPSCIEKRLSNSRDFLRLTLKGDGSFDWEFLQPRARGRMPAAAPRPSSRKFLRRPLALPYISDRK